MKVLHLFKTSYPDTRGGIEQVIHQLAAGSAKFGIKTDVLCLARSPFIQSTEIEGYTVHRAKLDFEISSTGFSISAFKKFSDLAHDADVIHYHFPWPFMDLMNLFIRHKKPTVLTYHSDIIRQRFFLKFYRPIQNAFLSSIDRIVATSENYLLTSDVLKKFIKNVTVIPIGLDKSTYPVASLKKLRHWKNRLPERFFLFVGVFRYYKGLEILIEAAEAIEHPIVIVGAGPIEAALKKKSEELHLKNVHFLGFLSDEDKACLLSLCYCMVLPSHLRAEAFGVSLLEGAMFGKPMISSEIGTGTSFVNIDKETGLVVSPSNSKSLAAAMDYLWKNPSEAMEMGWRAEERYWNLFTAEKMVKNYIKIYQELTTSQKL